MDIKYWVKWLQERNSELIKFYTVIQGNYSDKDWIVRLLFIKVKTNSLSKLFNKIQ